MSSSNSTVVITRDGKACVGREENLALDAFQAAIHGDLAKFLDTVDTLEDMAVEVFDLTYTNAGGNATDVLWCAWSQKRFDFVAAIAGAAIEMGRRPGVVFTGLLPVIVEQSADGSRELDLASDLLARMLRHIVALTGPIEMLRERADFASGPRGQAILSLVCAEKLAEDERAALGSAAQDAESSGQAGGGRRL